jgi:hypothetical protein
LRHPYVVAVGVLWAALNLANAAGTYYFFRAWAGVGRPAAAWGSVAAHVILPFGLPANILPGVPWFYLVELAVASALVGFIKWGRRDFSLAQGWPAVLLYISLFALLYPGTAVLVAINTGLGAAIAFHLRQLPTSLLYYTVFGVAANLLTAAAELPNKRFNLTRTRQR